MFAKLSALVAGLMAAGFSGSQLTGLVRSSQREARQHGTHYTKKGPGRKHNSDGLQRRLLLIKDPHQRKLESWRLGVGPFPYTLRD